MNTFTELFGESSDRFLLRWRGRQDGPYAASVIEAKLAANEIGLLHEIYYNGHWLTIRDFIAEREFALRAQRLANEEQERQAREEAERQAKELEEQHQAELAEERRKAAQSEARKTSVANGPVPLSAPPADPGSSGLRIIGILLLVAGLAVAAFFFLAFDTSVDSGVNGVGRVNNFGLMADRQNGIIVGIGLCIVGTIMLAIGSRGKK